MDVFPSVVSALTPLGGQFRPGEYQEISDHKAQNQVHSWFGHPVPMFPYYRRLCQQALNSLGTHKHYPISRDTLSISDS